MAPGSHNFSDGDKALIKEIAWEVSDALAARIKDDRARDVATHKNECLSRFGERVEAHATTIVVRHEERCLLERSVVAERARAKFFGVCAVCAFAGGGSVPFFRWLWQAIPQLITAL